MTTYSNKELLVKLTELTIKDVVEHYRDRINDKNTDKLIEHGIAKRVTAFVPDEWTMIDIAVYQMANDLNTLVQFTNDDGDTLTAIHNEEGVLVVEEPKKEWWDITWKMRTDMLGEWYGVPDIPDTKIQITPPTTFGCDGIDVNNQGMINDLIHKPISIGVSSRGCAKIDDPIRFTEISWIDNVSAPIPDSKGTSGWSEEVTRPVKMGSFYPKGIENYDSRMVGYDPHTTTEDFIFPNPAISEGRGSLVETLPSGDEADDLAYFQHKIRTGMGLPSSYFEPIEFTLDDLEELTELINTVESQEMKF